MATNQFDIPKGFECNSATTLSPAEKLGLAKEIADFFMYACEARGVRYDQEAADVLVMALAAMTSMKYAAESLPVVTR